MTRDLPLLPCGHRTRHTQTIGCCAGCGLLFSSDSAFEKHRHAGECLTPEESGLVPRPSPSAPDEVVFGFPGLAQRPTWWTKKPQDAIPASRTPALSDAGPQNVRPALGPPERPSEGASR